MPRWHYRDAALLWLYPPAFVAHVTEELVGGEGFRQWIGRISGGTLPLETFLAINAIGLIVVTLAVVAAVRREAAGWAAVALATLVSLNAVLHLLGTAYTGAYSPGLVTGMVIYLPLGALVLLRAASQASVGTIGVGVAVAVAAHALVSAVAFSAAGWPSGFRAAAATSTTARTRCLPSPGTSRTCPTAASAAPR